MCREKLMKGICKYCRMEDYIALMHEDKYTHEYYHQHCRPSHKLRKVV